LKVVGETVESASLSVSVPGGVEFSGDVHRDILGVDLDGHFGGGVTSRSFDAEAGVTLKVPGGISAKGDGVINQVGLAGCASARVLWANVSIGAAHRWNGSSSLLQDACGFSELKSLLGARDAAAAGSAARTIPISSGERQLNLIVTGSGGAPAVMLTEGGARQRILPDTHGAFGHAVYVAIGVPSLNRTYIALAMPAKGRLGVESAAGQGPLASVASTVLMPSPRVSTAVVRRGSGHYVLRWKARHLGGQTLVFEDVGRYGETEILRTTRTRGAANFRIPPHAWADRHRIRVLVERGGLVQQSLAGSPFRVPARRLGMPHVTIRIARGQAAIHWSGVTGVTGYRVYVRASDGRSLFFSRAARVHSVSVPAAESLRVTVQGVVDYSTFGPARTTVAKEKPAPKKRRRHRRK
jgi:hypothetical protein